jgi:hypothetical protein
MARHARRLTSAWGYPGGSGGLGPLSCRGLEGQELDGCAPRWRDRSYVPLIMKQPGAFPSPPVAEHVLDRQLRRTFMQNVPVTLAKKMLQDVMAYFPVACNALSASVPCILSLFAA